MLKNIFKLVSVVLLLAAITPLSATERMIRLATTTSTENSGLLNKLLPPFEKQTGINVQVIAVGTGKALRMGRDGDVDVVLVHDRVGEEEFVAEGHGVNRREVMYNDFVIVGPANDPAAVNGIHNVAEALQKIVDSKSLFISRGDASGTHKKELRLWKILGLKPGGDWYREAGQGMGKVLQITGELQAYTLTDRGTWLAYRSKSPLKLLVEGDKRLFNPYGIIAVNPARYADSHYRAAMELIAWVTSVEGQTVIHDYRIDGSPLFIPMAVPIP